MTIPVAQSLEQDIRMLAKLFGAGRFGDVIKHGARLADRYPRSALLANLLGLAHGRISEGEAAVRHLERAVRLDPGFADAYNNLGVALQHMGRSSRAMRNIRRALLINPTHVGAEMNRGTTLQGMGRTTEAQSAFRAVLKSAPRHAGALMNLGACLLENNRPEEALACYEKTLAIRPDRPNILNNKALCLKSLGRSEEAIPAYHASLTLRPDLTDAYNNMGVCLKDLGFLSAALKQYERSLKLQPNHVDTHANVCELNEISNRTQDLIGSITRADNAGVGNTSDIKYYKAVAAFRDKRYKAARVVLDSVADRQVSPYRRIAFLKLKGRVLDKTQDFERAFEAFSEMNALRKASIGKAMPAGDAYLASAKSLSKQLVSASPATLNWQDTSGPSPLQPVFLIGFPRSGTTLLDTILRSHSAIAVMEEKPMITNAVQTIGGAIELEHLSRLKARDLDALRHAYADQALAYLEPAEIDKTIIDKLPLNALNAPLIHRLFPEAKFILSVRHPLDAILSCFMQDFDLNSAMLNMLDLPRIVELYCLTMEIWARSQSHLDLQTHRIRYEDLTVDMPGEVGRLLNFLDLEWEDSVSRYTETALGRGVIRTPSYSQVIQPLYRDSTDRWRNYARHLAPHIERVRPWIHYFGYDEA